MSISGYISMIRMHDDPVLRKICIGVDHGEDVRLLAKTMQKVCRAADGLGLAACQIGVLKRVVVVMGVVAINPIITWRGDDRVTEKEGCLSYPGFICPIERYQQIEVTYETLQRSPMRELVDGLEARCWQHEIDHLDGICLVGNQWRARYGKR